MTETAEQKVDRCLLEAKAKGLRIIGGGALFEWEGGRVVACDAIGAVMLSHGQAVKGFPSGWLTRVLRTLGVDWGWFRTFCSGFDRGELMEFVSEVNGKEVRTVAVPSRFGLQMRKKHRLGQ